MISRSGPSEGDRDLRIVLAVGGVYIGGGIAPKLRPKLEDGTFMRAFRDKGRMAPLLESYPVHLCLNDRAPLLGAAQVGLQLAHP